MPKLFANRPVLFSILVHGLLAVLLIVMAKVGPKVSLVSSQITVEVVAPGSTHFPPPAPHRQRTVVPQPQVVAQKPAIVADAPAPAVDAPAAETSATAAFSSPPSTPIGNTLNASSGEMGAYVSQIFEKIEAVKVYPKDALLREEFGQVIICLTIQKDGKIQDSHIEVASPFASLNTAALQILQTLGSLPPLPTNAPPTIRVKIPIRFELKTL